MEGSPNNKRLMSGLKRSPSGVFFCEPLWEAIYWLSERDPRPKRDRTPAMTIPALRSRELSLRTSAFLCVLWTLTLPLATTSRLEADWLVMKDGARLRGIDGKKDGTYYRLTLEDGREVMVSAAKVKELRVSPSDETVEHRGKTVLFRAKVLEAVKERKKALRDRLADIELWASVEGRRHPTKKKAALASAARTRVEKLSPGCHLAQFGFSPGSDLALT